MTDTKQAMSYTGPVVLPKNFRAACAAVDTMRAEYEHAEEAWFAVAQVIGSDPAILPLREAKDVARDKWQRHQTVLARLRPS